MKDSTLIKLCRNLTKNDLRSLRKTVRSPYFNQREDVIRLMDYIIENLDGQEHLMDRNKVFKAVFPGEDFEMPLLRYAMTFLLAVIRQYLIIEELSTNKVEERLYLIGALQRRGCKDLLEKETEDALELNNKEVYRHSFYHLNEFKLQLEQYTHNTKQKRQTNLNIEPVVHAFTAFQVPELIKIGCLLLSHKTHSNQEYFLPFLENALKLVESGSMQNEPASVLWFHTYKCLQSPDNEDNYKQLSNLLTQGIALLPPMEIAEIFYSAINFCIKRLNKGEQHYLREAFELYNQGLSSGALIPFGILSKFTYFNAMAAGIKLKETAWIEPFLIQYKQYLPPSEQENAYNYNLAFFNYFLKQDYDKAMELLQKIVQFDDPHYNLDARRMLIRIYFETDALSALESQLDSYRAFLRRHKEVGYHHELHSNFIHYVGKMITTDLSRAENKRKLREKVFSTQIIADKDWLLKQLA